MLLGMPYAKEELFIKILFQFKKDIPPLLLIVATEALLNYMEASYEKEWYSWTEQRPNIGKLFAVVLM